MVAPHDSKRAMSGLLLYCQYTMSVILRLSTGELALTSQRFVTGQSVELSKVVGLSDATVQADGLSDSPGLWDCGAFGRGV